MKISRGAFLAFGLVIGFVAGAQFGPLTGHAQVLPSWGKDEILPVLCVKPGVVGFIPCEEASLHTWSKEQVVPLCPVKPGIGGFVPVDGTSIGNTWAKDKVRPFLLVRESLGRFVPKE